jgi:mevalonate kinase
MINRDKSYNAKLMLAGEYGVILGSEALTVPLRYFSAKLAQRKGETRDPEIIGSVASLRKLLTYIRSLPKNSFYATPDTDGLEKALKKGYYIESTIPQGYGIGSSGAVSALVYDQFFTSGKESGLQQQRKDLATLESCFHGKSSGVDAMTCYSGTPLHFLPGGEIRYSGEDPLKPHGGYRFFLLDSGQVFDTAPLVHFFLEKMKNKDFSKFITSDYFDLIKKFISTLNGTSDNDPALIFRAISDLQWNHFSRMIPENMAEAWTNGQVSNTYYLKLNGSGGGFMLGIAHESAKDEVEYMLNGNKIIWITN